MYNQRPFIMSIAGYDPSGGAGVLADIKAFEQHKAYGFAVITSNTFQNDKEVKAINWLPVYDILKQIDVITDKFQVDIFKIGIVNSSDTFIKIKTHILNKNPDARIIWDPILESSSGFTIFEMTHSIKEILNSVYLVTPNVPEYMKLIKDEELAIEISEHTAIYLKGGHFKENPGLDILYNKKQKSFFEPEQMPVTSKHGSGCILSSSIGANLAFNYSLDEACKKAKHYTEKALSSNTSLLAWHYH
jgi:hydroxymethylpyrimidine/phosphomethylpyrimidine kinase